MDPSRIIIYREGGVELPFYAERAEGRRLRLEGIKLENLALLSELPFADDIPKVEDDIPANNIRLYEPDPEIAEARHRATWTDNGERILGVLYNQVDLDSSLRKRSSPQKKKKTALVRGKN